MAEGGRRLRGALRKHRPLVSIIVVIYRDCNGLRRLLGSVLPYVAERRADIELLVIDGGSDEAILELLRQCDLQIDYWLSESDRGIYDAMNKGLAAATGEYILHLNAGDRLLAVPERELRECAASGVDVACFPVTLNGGRLHRPLNSLTSKLDNTWHHQGTFYKRTMHPGYDLRFKVYADFDLNQRLMKAGKSVRIFQTVVADHSTDGISSSVRNKREIYRIIRKNYGCRFLPLAFGRFQINAFRYRVRQLWSARAERS